MKCNGPTPIRMKDAKVEEKRIEEDLPMYRVRGRLMGPDEAGNFLFYTAATVMGLIASPGKS